MTGPEVIGQEAFIAEAEAVVTGEQLATGISEAVTAATALQAKLGDIASGKLVIEPPLTDEKMGYYRGRTEGVLEVGLKMVKALEGTGAGREEGTEQGELKGAGTEAKGAKPRKP